MDERSPRFNAHAEHAKNVAKVAAYATELDGLTERQAEEFLQGKGFEIGRFDPENAVSTVPVLYFVGADGRPCILRTSGSLVEIWSMKHVSSFGDPRSMGAAMSPSFERLLAMQYFGEKNVPRGAPEAHMGWFRRQIDRILSLFDDGKGTNDESNPYDPPKS